MFSHVLERVFPGLPIYTLESKICFGLGQNPLLGNKIYKTLFARGLCSHVDTSDGPRQLFEWWQCFLVLATLVKTTCQPTRAARQRTVSATVFADTSRVSFMITVTVTRFPNRRRARSIRCRLAAANEVASPCQAAAAACFCRSWARS